MPYIKAVKASQRRRHITKLAKQAKNGGIIMSKPKPKMAAYDKVGGLAKDGDTAKDGGIIMTRRARLKPKVVADNKKAGDASQR